VTTPDLERRLAVVLQQHAEDALNRTDTPSTLTELLVDAERDLLRRRTRIWRTGALVAAAATIAAIAAVTALGRPETTEPAHQPTPSEQIATAYLHAWDSFDRPRLASYLADTADIDGWRRSNRWEEAVGFRMLTESCVEQSSTTAQTSTTAGTHVVCTFDYHALRSDELGLGPYSHSTFTATIKDGKILDTELEYADAKSGYTDEIWGPFAAWVAEAYPRDAAAMYANWPYQGIPAVTDRALELWEQHVKDYVAAQG